MTTTYPLARPSAFAANATNPLATLDSDLVNLTDTLNSLGNGASTLSTVTITTATITNANIATGSITTSNIGTLSASTLALSGLANNSVLIISSSSNISAVLPGASGNVLTSNGTVWTSQAALSGSSLQKSVFTTSGTFTASKTTTHKITVVGGGGGSGGVNTTGIRCSQGGAAGGLAIGWQSLVAATPYTVTIGAAGAAGLATPTSGGNGSASIFVGTATITANGGGGSSLQADSTLVGPPAGGTASGGDLNLQGASPQGGQFASVFSDGIATNGANSPFGSGGAGAIQHSAIAATAATGYGSGGGGAVANAGSVAGQAGAPGVVIIEWIA